MTNTTTAEAKFAVEVVPSLAMQVERTSDGGWILDAPWLEVPVVGTLFEAVYYLAMRARRAA